jgi:hypothetical protein
MSLVEHAEREMKLIGLDKKDAVYDGMLYDAVMELVKVFAEQGHSGMSAGRTLFLFDKVARFKNLSPLTNSPNEWMEVSDYAGPEQKGVWQNRRDSECFSNDGGKTYYNLNEREKIITAAPVPDEIK